jgi:hypothetical protein
MAVKPVTLGVLAAGIVVLWAGATDRSPATVLKNLFTGVNPKSAAQGDNTITTDAYTSTAGDTSDDTGDAGAAGGSATVNQGIARLLAAPYGWSIGQNWSDLVSLWNRESSWNNKAQNPSSGAYGIPQALPYTKMPKSAWPPANGGSANASAQISWGLSYIKQRYGNPINAWAHEEANGWY